MVKEREEESISGLHHCDSHTAMTCYLKDFVALSSTTKKMAR